jgi:hypothetical protein
VTPFLKQKFSFFNSKRRPKGFSPSSLNNYIRNPLNFYKQNLLNINDVLRVELALTLLAPLCMMKAEELYTPLVGIKPYTVELLNGIKKNIQQIVSLNFEKTYKEGILALVKNLPFHFTLFLNTFKLFIDALK